MLSVCQPQLIVDLMDKVGAKNAPAGDNLGFSFLSFMIILEKRSKEMRQKEREKSIFMSGKYSSFPFLLIGFIMRCGTILKTILNP
jgi:hypothetical protein